MEATAWFLIADASKAATFSSGRVLGIVLWVGFVALTVAFLVLMRTRWGQVKPLSKCVVLSIFAHLLLFMYAYSTRLFHDAPGGGGDEPISLAFVESESSDPQEDPTEETSSPWDKFAVEDLVEPEIDPVTRPPLDDSHVNRTPDPTEWIAGSEPVPKQSIPVSEMERPTAEAPEIARNQVKASQVAAVPIDVPSTVSAAEPQPAVLPEAAQPDRVRAMPVVRRIVDEDNQQQLPSELVDIGSRMQQLADIPARAETADAHSGSADQLAQSANRSDATTDSTGIAHVDDDPDHSRATGLADVPQPPVTAVSRPAAMAMLEDIAEQAPPRLGDGQSLPITYRLRTAEQRSAIAGQLGNNDRAEAAVEAGLAWLAAQQEDDGRWDADRWGSGVESHVHGHNRQGAGTSADTGVTGLAVLAFLASGHTHLDGTYRTNVQHALEYLLRSQAADGNLAGDARFFARMYCHGMASLALSEALAMTGDVRIRPFVERAVHYSIGSQHPTTGGWRYHPGDQGDMSQFGWQVMALKSAELAGFEIPAHTRAGMHHFLSRCSQGRSGGLASYKPQSQVTRSMTAESLACRYFLGLQPSRALVDEATDFIMGELPQSGTPNLYYWYYGTLAMFQVQGPRWNEWNSAMQRHVLRRQRTDGHLAGSWDADTVWGGYGGRIYSTAMATLCLEVYYRYLPLTTMQESQ